MPHALVNIAALSQNEKRDRRIAAPVTAAIV